MKQTDLDNRFVFHPVKDPAQGEVYGQIRAAAKVLAEFLNANCPDGRELSLAVTHIEEAVFWGNAAIARASGVTSTDQWADRQVSVNSRSLLADLELKPSDLTTPRQQS